MERQDLIKKIQGLPPNQLAEIEQFVESVTRRSDCSESSLHQALSDYANEHAGTTADIDSELETASADHLLRETSFRRTRRRRYLRRATLRQQEAYGISNEARKRGYGRRKQ